MERSGLQWVLIAIYIVGSNLVANYCQSRAFSPIKAGLFGVLWGGVSVLIISIGSIVSGGRLSFFMENINLAIIIVILAILLPGVLSVLKVLGFMDKG